MSFWAKIGQFFSSEGKVDFPYGDPDTAREAFNKNENGGWKGGEKVEKNRIVGRPPFERTHHGSEDKWNVSEVDRPPWRYSWTSSLSERQD